MPTGKDTISIYREAQASDSLDDAPAASATPHHTISGCLVWPRTSTEIGKGEVVIDGQNVWAPGRNVDILATDTVELRGERYSVEGVPGDYGKGKLIVLNRVGKR